MSGKLTFGFTDVSYTDTKFGHSGITLLRNAARFKESVLSPNFKILVSKSYASPKGS